MLSNSSTVQLHIKVTKDCGVFSSRAGQQGFPAGLCKALWSTHSCGEHTTQGRSSLRLFKIPGSTTRLLQVWKSYYYCPSSAFNELSQRVWKVSAQGRWSHSGVFHPVGPGCSSWQRGSLQFLPAWIKPASILMDWNLCYISCWILFIIIPGKKPICPFSIWCLRNVQLRVIGIMVWWSQFFPTPPSVMEHW